MTKEQHSIWDDYVPIKKDGRQTTVYLTDPIEGQANYNEFIDVLNSAYEGDTIRLIISTPGGVVDSGIMIRNAIQNSNAKIVADLQGTVASAGTMIALACDELIVSPNLSFMCHEVSVSNIGGKFSDVKNMQNFYEKQFKQLSADVYTGFLTEEEMEEMSNGKEIWLNAEEVAERWAKMKAL